MTPDLTILKFCAEEVGRQYALSREPEKAAHAVYWMMTAWEHARMTYKTYRTENEAKSSLSLDLIRKWGQMVEPQLNEQGWRTVGVRVGWEVCPSPDDVPRLLDRFGENLHAMTPEEAYIAFLKIHPFRDGNGRVAKIIYFWLRGKLDSPDIAEVPNPWGIRNP